MDDLLERLDQMLDRDLTEAMAQALNAGCGGNAGPQWVRMAVLLREAANIADQLATGVER